ncbi:MAG TPA: hemerythrin domain-containing protein [Chitinophagales bacterium]
MDDKRLFQQIIERYELQKQQLSELEVNKDFVRVILKAFENEAAFPREEMQQFPISVILDYLQKTHHYYLFKKLPEIEQSIYALLKNYEREHPLLIVLTRFFTEYRNELVSHFKAEEKQLFPYICFLEKAQENLEVLPFFERTQYYSISKFITGHQDTEDDLKEVRNIIQQYSTSTKNESLSRILLHQLETFEQDLAIHALTEDDVLIPKALALEQKLMVHFEQKTNLN